MTELAEEFPQLHEPGQDTRPALILFAVYTGIASVVIGVVISLQSLSSLNMFDALDFFPSMMGVILVRGQVMGVGTVAALLATSLYWHKKHKPLMDESVDAAKKSLKGASFGCWKYFLWAPLWGLLATVLTGLVSQVVGVGFYDIKFETFWGKLFSSVTGMDVVQGLLLGLETPAVFALLAWLTIPRMLFPRSLAGKMFLVWIGSLLFSAVTNFVFELPWQLLD